MSEEQEAPTQITSEQIHEEEQVSEEVVEAQEEKEVVPSELDSDEEKENFREKANKLLNFLGVLLSHFQLYTFVNLEQFDLGLWDDVFDWTKLFNLFSFEFDNSVLLTLCVVFAFGLSIFILCCMSTCPSCCCILRQENENTGETVTKPCCFPLCLVYLVVVFVSLKCLNMDDEGAKNSMPEMKRERTANIKRLWFDFFFRFEPFVLTLGFILAIVFFPLRTSFVLETTLIVVFTLLFVFMILMIWSFFVHEKLNVAVVTVIGKYIFLFALAPLISAFIEIASGDQ